MADTGIFCTTTEVLRKAGANASSTSTAEAFVNDFVTQAESYINCATRRNWSDDYSSLNVDVKGLLKEAASNLAAVYCINYDMFLYTQLEEAETMINVLMARLDQIIAVLRDLKTQTFIDGETS